ncbi:PadR family transcriptional regulator [Roseomonas sp. CAU 1739]|uniref:PadR family transcriptional regulator n=1 Tax=Roseomonas sp. CAU 1739 TaxID=3140364 RepID=UPI00325B8571
MRHAHPRHRDHDHDCRFARPDRTEHGPRLGHHHRGGGRSGLGRFFAHGDLRLVILGLIAEKPSHGYEIIKAIEERVGGAYSPSPGVIYPTLTLLEELGYVTVSTAAEGGRKLHEVTEQGRAFLAANRPTHDALLARMDEAGRAQGGGPAPQIIRAMENLKLALRMRMARGPLTAEQADAVAAALDAAATGVERS